MCIYNDEWTEVHWNTEAKTYALGARIPQLDKYNTEGSDIQVLVDKELEKMSPPRVWTVTVDTLR